MDCHGCWRRRRHDELYVQLGEFGGKFRITGRVVVGDSNLKNVVPALHMAQIPKALLYAAIASIDAADSLIGLSPR